MRPEKKYYVDEIGGYLDNSDYLYVADYHGLTVLETATLRKSLAEHDAEFHVIKNRMLGAAIKERNLPELNEYLLGQNAVVTGGNNPPGVAKAINKFYKANDKVKIKGGFLNKIAINEDEVNTLASLPSEEVLKAQFLGVLMAPAQRMASILQAVPQGLLNVLTAKV